MTKEQKMTEIEHFIRLFIPIEQRIEEISEQEQIRIAFEKFENTLSKKGHQNLKIIIHPTQTLQYESVTLVFSVFLETPMERLFTVLFETPEELEAKLELRKQILTRYFNEVPDDWKLDVISKIVNGEYFHFYL